MIVVKVQSQVVSVLVSLVDIHAWLAVANVL